MVIEGLSAYREASARLSALLNTDARRAVEEARQLRGKGGLKDSVLVLRAGILIDGGELASDLGDGGMLALQRDLRNAGTHRFCVLHDLGNTPSRVSAAVDHHSLDSFSDQTIATLQIVRSAILYVRDAINAHEARQAKRGLHLPLDVVPHHYIRGEE